MHTKKKCEDKQEKIYNFIQCIILNTIYHSETKLMHHSAVQSLRQHLYNQQKKCVIFTYQREIHAISVSKKSIDEFIDTGLTTTALAEGQSACT
jgi:cell fate (sporulation/competence/biofilm development) regulator YmcA (YheA/YmcA/DUF963 family)